MDDKEILQIFRQDSRQEYAFNLIVRKYNERLYWHIRKLTCSHEDTNDLLQNCFIKVWNNLHTFREDSGLYTWLYRIATNEALSFLKKEKLKSFFSLSDYTKQLENKLQADSSFEGSELQLALQKAILTLPNKQRIVFNMRYYDETPYEEMSEILGTSVGALKASYHHAQNKIQEIMKASF